MRIALLFVMAAGLAGCDGQPVPDTPVGRGRQHYLMFCAACHNPTDPRKEGSQGPDVAGSSLELLRAKVLRNEYPEGYTPKRQTRNMVPLALGESHLADIAAYLAAPAESDAAK